MKELKNLLNIAELAQRYYEGKGYTRNGAGKQFHQDKQKDKKALNQIVKIMCHEAIRAINKLS